MIPDLRANSPGWVIQASRTCAPSKSIPPSCYYARSAFIRPGSGSGPEPGRDLLDQPRVAIGIGEARERPVAGALGLGARLPRLDRERRAVPDVTHLDATADELVIGGLDVGDDQLPLGRAWRGRRESLAERDRGPRARGCELDDAKALHRGDVAVEVPTQALIEFLGSVDVGHGDDHDLELHVDPPDARVAACVGYVGGAHRYLLICAARNPQLGLRIGDATKRTLVDIATRQRWRRLPP